MFHCFLFSPLHVENVSLTIDIHGSKEIFSFQTTRVFFFKKRGRWGTSSYETSSCLFKNLKSLDQISLFVPQKIDFAYKKCRGLKEYSEICKSERRLKSVWAAAQRQSGFFFFFFSSLNPKSLFCHGVNISEQNCHLPLLKHFFLCVCQGWWGKTLLKLNSL